MSISVVSYDPEWTVRFEVERALLERVLAPWLCDGVHHIGSTSVPGLAAKPIIDMMAGVRDLEEARPAIEVLQAESYVHAPHRPRAYWFYRPSSSPGGGQTHGLHLTEPGSDLWTERLAFRDALRADALLREEYQTLKEQLAQAHGEDLRTYTDGKRNFVARVLGDAGITLAPRARPATPHDPAEPGR